jgi:alkylated DNA repair dioxygenase AlkB
MINHIINEKDGGVCQLSYIPNFIDDKLSKKIMNEMNNINDWKIGKTNDGKIIKRKQKWFQIDNKPFCKVWREQYDRWKSHNYTTFLLDLQDLIQSKINNYLINHENIKKPKYNSLLINYYENGNNQIAPHQDNKLSFGNEPTIALLSFGDTRTIILERTKRNLLKRNKEEFHLNKKIKLEHNSLFIMAGDVQKNYCHYIPKENNKRKRYSLTFREFIK